MKLRVNAAVEMAVPLFERVAAIDGQIAIIQANRDQAIADFNAVADALLAEPMAERAALVEQLHPWWERNKGQVLTGKRKSAVIGGCDVGNKASTPVLFPPRDVTDNGLAQLQAAGSWAKPYIRVTYAADKVALKAGLDHKTHGDKLRGLGFGMTEPVELFFLARAKTTGTIAG